MTYYLRSNTLAEPLVNNWYAWPMLISPTTAALITLNSHMSILQSYVQMPKMHAAAVLESKMRGGPFIDFNGEDKVAEISAYLEQLQANCGHIIELAQGLINLNQILLENADGHSLIPLYDQIPPVLRGYVELVYDANNHPMYRIIEGLLYRSHFYNTAGQAMMLSTLAGDSRSFVLSTPRISTGNDLMWKIPFSDPAIDTLFSTRERPRSKKELQTFYTNQFEDNKKNHDLFWSLFSDKAPKTRSDYKRYEGPGVRIRYFGHACVLIETNQTTIFVDTMVSYGYETDIPRFTYDDLPEKIDYVILTHSHQDHVMLEHLFQLRYKIENIVVPKNASGSIQDPSLKLMFKNLKFKNVIELDEMDTISLPDGEIIGIPFFGEHGDLYIQSKMAYVLRLKDKSLLFAADSNNLEPKLYEHLQREIPKLDVIFLGMECDGAPLSWLYGSLMGRPLARTMDQSRRLNGSDCERAMDIVRRFDCPEVYIYAMGQEPWLGYITSIEYTGKSRPIEESDKLLEICHAENRIAERLYLKKEIVLS